VLNHFKLVLLAISAAPLAHGQPQFEVASVKPFIAGPPTAGRGSSGCVPFKMDRGRVDICAPLAKVIEYAYRIPPGRIVGPEWLRDRKVAFAIAAKLPDGAPDNQVPEMLQALLADRFKLAVHRGTREEAVTALVVAKSGLKLQEAAAVEDDPGAIDNPMIGPVRKTESAGPTLRWEAPNITLAGLAELCSGVGFVPPVVDMTGVKGRYQVDLTVSLKDTFAAAASAAGVRDDPAAADNARTDMHDAMRNALNDSLQKFGLQLEVRRGTVEILIVDHVEKMPSGN
jgi:uncharacterized protein (TIGR03435 family)